MPGYIQLPSTTLVCDEAESVAVNTSRDLNTVVAAQLTAGGEDAPVGGSYADFFVTIANTGSDLAYLATTADIPEGGAETAAQTTQVIPAGTALADALTFGPYRYGRAPILRLLDGAVCPVTILFGRA
jgi:hypothetical protein